MKIYEFSFFWDFGIILGLVTYLRFKGFKYYFDMNILHKYRTLLKTRLLLLKSNVNIFSRMKYYFYLCIVM